MAGCAALFCNNSSAKGFLMRRFPRDRRRRRDWQLRMKRGNWEPTDNSYLCEVHFSAEMWEKIREDGKRKLKFNAVPTLFFFNSPASPDRKSTNGILKSLTSQENATSNCSPTVEYVKSTAPVVPSPTKLSIVSVSPAPIERLSPEKIVLLKNIPPLLKPMEKITNTSQTDMETKASPAPSVSQSPLPIERLPPADTLSLKSTSSTEAQSMLSKEATVQITALKQKIENYEKVYLKERRRALTYRRKLVDAKNKIKSLVEKNTTMQFVYKLFNEDQICALRKMNKQKSTKFMKWSSDTITRALKLKLKCGIKGYVELIQQGYPFPSLRTLQRRLESMKLEREISPKVMDCLEIDIKSFDSQESDDSVVILEVFDDDCEKVEAFKQVDLSQ